MKTPAELRAEAADKYRTAALARRIGPSLSLAADRVSMHALAEQKEAEGAALVAEADAMERQNRND